jgi:hypothetical protein
MASYSIEWNASAAKELRKLPGQVIIRVLSEVEMLATNPRPAGVRKLTDTERVKSPSPSTPGYLKGDLLARGDGTPRGEGRGESWQTFLETPSK